MWNHICDPNLKWGKHMLMFFQNEKILKAVLWNTFPFWSLEMTWGRFVWGYFESPPRCHVLRFFRQDSFDLTFGFRRWASEILVRDMSAGGALNLPNCKRFRYLNIQHLTVLFLESCFPRYLITLIYSTRINYILFF